MITVISLAAARVLIVGKGDLVDEILRNLASHGVCNLTAIDASTAPDKKYCQFIKQDPEEFIQVDQDYFKSFHIVLVVNQPRSFELTLSDLRWPNDGEGSDHDLPMIVMRNVSNICKMRCQYQQLLVDGCRSSRFVSLRMELLPWTDEKRALIASTITDEFMPEKNPTLQAYLTAALAVVMYHQSKGSWPGPQDREQVQIMEEQFVITSQPKIQEFIDIFCEKGLAAAHETTAILGRIVVLDAIKLLTGNGQPINNTSLEEVIRVVAKT